MIQTSSQTQNSLLLENLPEYAIFSINKEGVISSWTVGVERILGYTQDEFIGSSIDIIFTDEEAESGVPQQQITKVANQNQGEFRGWRTRKDGTRFWCCERITAVYDIPEKIDGFFYMLRDETLALKNDNHSGGWLQTALNVGRIGTWVWDIPNDIVKADTNLASFFNLPKQDAKGLPLEEYFKVIHPEDIALVTRTISESITNESTFICDYRIVQPDGGLVWVEARGKIELDSQRRPVQLNGVMVDISERKKAEEALSESQNRYRALFDALDSGFCVIEVIFDEDHKPVNYRFIEINPAFENQTGLKDAVGKMVRDLVPDLEEFWFETYGRVASTGESIRFQNFTQKMNKWFDVYAFRFGAIKNHYVALLFTDITDRKLNEESLKQAHLKSEEINRLKDEFLATLSHELRTPLNAILGWSNLLRTEQLAPEMRTQGLETIERNARAQSSLIDDLLDISRILSGKMRLELRPVELSALLEDCLETVSPAAQVKNIRLSTDFKEKSAFVSGDPDRMSQIFWNLLTNAIKFTPRGGKIEVSLQRENSQFLVYISDNGQGISSEFLPHVFDRFRQADSSSTRRFGGLGIGLGLVRHLTEAHGGSVAVSSEGEGMGAVFTVSLPLMPMLPEIDAIVRPTTEKIAKSLASSEENLPLLSNLRVLIVDDEADACTLTRLAVEQRGAFTEVVDSAQKAFDKIVESRDAGQPYDVIISDIGMPVEDGFSLMRRIRQLEHEKGGFIPAIALTAYASHKDHTTALLAGFQIHIAKPIEAPELIAAIGSLKGLISRKSAI
jgi:PAS domain S-box-containing protein